MTIIVDEAKIHWDGRYWCHMVSDNGIEELHAFAKKLRLKRSWFQNGNRPHYDLTANKRKQAIKLGARLVTSKELVKVLKGRY